MTEYTHTTEQIAGKVRGQLAEHRTTQAQLGAVLGLGQQAVSNRMAGDVRFSLRELWLIAGHLQVPLCPTLVTDVRQVAADQLGVPVQLLEDGGAQ